MRIIERTDHVVRVDRVVVERSITCLPDNYGNPPRMVYERHRVEDQVRWYTVVGPDSTSQPVRIRDQHHQEALERIFIDHITIHGTERPYKTADRHDNDGTAMVDPG